MFSARSWSPAEMKIFVPVMRKLPSAKGSARLRSRPRSVPQCGSVRFMVPVQRPSIIGGRNSAFCCSVPPLAMALAAPWVNPANIEKARLALVMISRTAMPSTWDSPWPPYSGEAVRPVQPASAYCR
ncbi:hypothetical protein D3C76_1463730 [compost metagenome]